MLIPLSEQYKQSDSTQDKGNCFSRKATLIGCDPPLLLNLLTYFRDSYTLSIANIGGSILLGRA